jgi:hypothetical protein
MVLLSKVLATVPEEDEGTKEQQQQHKHQAAGSHQDVLTYESISRRVRDDIKQVLANSWELREVWWCRATVSSCSTLPMLITAHLHQTNMICAQLAVVTSTV